MRIMISHLFFPEEVNTSPACVMRLYGLSHLAITGCGHSSTPAAAVPPRRHWRRRRPWRATLGLCALARALVALLPTFGFVIFSRSGFGQSTNRSIHQCEQGPGQPWCGWRGTHCLRNAGLQLFSSAVITQPQSLPQRHQEVVNVGLVADGCAMLGTENGFLASHVVQILSLLSLGFLVIRRKGSTEMHRTKSMNESVYLLRLQKIEGFPLHGLEDLVSTAVIDVGVVEPGREHDHIMI